MARLLVERSKIRANLATVRQKTGRIPLMGVLKGDAYGLGLLETARCLREEGISFFGVDAPADGLLLRESGFSDEEILLLRSTALPEEIDMLLDAHLIATVGSQDAAVALSALAERRSTVAVAHVYVDTGTGRASFTPQGIDTILSVYRYMPNIAVAGLYTYVNAHAGRKAALAQCGQLRAMAQRIDAEGFDVGLVHAAGSTLLFTHETPLFDMVRVGAAVSGRIAGKHALARVGVLEAPIVELGRLPKASRVGTTASVKLRRDTQFAMVAAGKADGVRFAPRGKGLFSSFWELPVYLDRQRLKVLGNVGLSHLLVDVTGLACSVGQSVHIVCDPVQAARPPRQYV